MFYQPSVQKLNLSEPSNNCVASTRDQGETQPYSYYVPSKRLSRIEKEEIEEKEQCDDDVLVSSGCWVNVTIGELELEVNVKSVISMEESFRELVAEKKIEEWVSLSLKLIILDRIRFEKSEFEEKFKEILCLYSQFRLEQIEI